MARLTYHQRRELPPTRFVFPKERSYPIPDEAHARNALSRVMTYGTPEEQKIVIKAVAEKFPGIEISYPLMKKIRPRRVRQLITSRRPRIPR